MIAEWPHRGITQVAVEARKRQSLAGIRSAATALGGVQGCETADLISRIAPYLRVALGDAWCATPGGCSSTWTFRLAHGREALRALSAQLHFRHGAHRVRTFRDSGKRKCGPAPFTTGRGMTPSLTDKTVKSPRAPLSATLLCPDARDRFTVDGPANREKLRYSVSSTRHGLNAAAWKSSNTALPTWSLTVPRSPQYLWLTVGGSTPWQAPLYFGRAVTVAASVKGGTSGERVRRSVCVWLLT